LRKVVAFIAPASLDVRLEYYMDFTDYMIVKLVVLAIFAFVAGVISGWH
jgi:hypothetical protein